MINIPTAVSATKFPVQLRLQYVRILINRNKLTMNASFSLFSLIHTENYIYDWYNIYVMSIILNVLRHFCTYVKPYQNRKLFSSYQELSFLLYP